ncbi:BapA/Bap/LapF family prefix-like domain-containing protein [Acinetobacter gerneri]|uniref:Biofilm-associated protein BapA-like prefix-like domain-containing protein n=1 Tax=Acinetobacter gerneri DSM 14967 = CIP 107464 = MTCC 9824 TaxID=1120926 RepID=N8ZJQ7_9GAMM|nr:BapA prefix-like domain-containing protein [Acinetobacter gerneri]ENV31978.1 hypothetical protein F960_03363 [Acinetobacter gerneri DSM 14967 = CIP 107464 = MTCC 9824]
MSNIQVISKKTHQILEKVNNNQIKLNGDSVVQIKASAQDVLSIERSGNNAIITLKNGEKIIIENYFNAENSNSVVFDDNNQLSVLSFQQWQWLGRNRRSWRYHYRDRQRQQHLHSDC